MRGGGSAGSGAGTTVGGAAGGEGHGPSPQRGALTGFEKDAVVQLDAPLPSMARVNLGPPTYYPIRFTDARGTTPNLLKDENAGTIFLFAGIAPISVIGEEIEALLYRGPRARA